MKNTILFTIILLTFCVSSCSTVNKLFHKSKHQSDSTYSHKENIDSVSKSDSSALHKENTTTYAKTDSAKTNEQTTITEHTTVKEFDTSGKVKKETISEKQTVINKGGQTGSLTVFNNAGKIDSSGWHKEAEVKKNVADSGHVKTKDKDVQKSVHKTRFPWWLLIIPVVGYLVYRNWPKIRAFGIHLITGL